MKLGSITAIGRPIDPSHASNRFVVAASVAAALATFGWRLLADLDDPASWAFRAGVAVFLGWAIGRELDPDDPSTAGIAGPLAPAGFAWGAPALGALAGFLIAGRLVVRTTGLSPTPLDSILLVIGAGYLGTTSLAWPAAAALVLAIGADRILPPVGPRRLLPIAAAAALAAGVVGVLWSDVPVRSRLGVVDWIVFGAVVVAGLSALRPPPPKVRGDLTGAPLERRRLIAARWGAIGGVATTIAVGGSAGFGAIAPLAAALVALPLARGLRVARLRGAAPAAPVAPAGDQKSALAS